jgi:uncharacterized membrane protein
LLPTIITIGLIWWVFDFLWNSLGKWIISAIGYLWLLAEDQGWTETPVNAGYIREQLDSAWWSKPLGVLLALLLIYLVGLFVGNFLGRTLYRATEALVMRIPFIRAVYPAVKQVTDFLLADRDQQFEGSRVVAVRPHANDIWSVALVTGSGLAPLNEKTKRTMVTVFVPSSPTAFSGYVMLAPREDVVELPMSVEEALRLLISGGVITPGKDPKRLGRRSAEPEAQLPPAAEGGSTSTTLAAGATSEEITRSTSPQGGMRSSNTDSRAEVRPGTSPGNPAAAPQAPRSTMAANVDP